MRALLCHPAGMVLLFVQATAAFLGLFARIESSLAVWLAGALFGLQAWFNYRFAVVYNAADTMFLIGLGATFAAALDPTEVWLQQTALLFLGVQVLLAYLMSGKAKVTAAAWRDGSHLIEILRGSAFRMEPWGRALARRPFAARGIARATIFLELIFPFSIVLPSPVFATILASGVLFHASVAFVMGLPGFFWSFVAAYPALYFLHERIAAAF